MHDYTGYNIHQLREMAHQRNIQPGRSKEETIKRIEEADKIEATARARAAATARAVAVEEAVDSLEKIGHISKTKARQLRRKAEETRNPIVYPKRPGGPPPREGMRYHPTKGYKAA